MKKNTLVKFKAMLPPGVLNQYPFADGERLLFLGEIVNMPGHAIVVDSDGFVNYGLHTEHFVELSEDEI